MPANFGLEALVAGTVALALVFALRSPARSIFGARAAYCLWLLVPAMIVAVAVPRVVTTVAPTVEMVSTDAVPQTPAPEVRAPAATAQGPETQFDLTSLTTPFLLTLWALGAGGYALLLLRGHRRLLREIGPMQAEWRGDSAIFHAATPDIGPALIGALRPRIVVPLDFDARYSPQEQKVVIAHERVHLVRGDAQVNLLVALCCALFWLHPLVHLAARLIRVDQELACDEVVVARHPDARRAYAEAMLKAQMIGTPVLLGCHWFHGGKRELRHRIARLALASSPARSATGGALAIVLICTGAVSAWAVQAPVFEPVPARGAHGPGGLIEAIQDDRIADAAQLIAAGADVNEARLGDGTPLILAARGGQLSLVRLLLDRGADPNLAVQGDGNPLIAAAAEGQIEIVQLLLAAGAKVDTVVPSDETALINAARHGHLDVVQRLVEAGADVNLAVMAPRSDAPDELRSPLGMARRSGHTQVIQYLIAHGARP